MFTFQILELFYKIYEIQICKRRNYKSCSFRGHISQLNFPGQTAASKCKGFPTFREKFFSYFRVCWVLGRTRIISGSTKHPAHPEDENGVSCQNVGKPSHVDAAVCQGKFHLKDEIFCGEEVRKMSADYMKHHSVRVKWQRKAGDRSNVLSGHDAVNALDNLQLDLQNKDLLIRTSSIPSEVLCTKTLRQNSRSYVIFHGF